ncbi:hypothetical protein CGRA01v4_12837 [Colletotrichum graminicola]|uniref:Uncharacterized protein n=1 Tax=Colletotrichum graminicola (strain M1.001 / M2 / FGSC 10212) TaxID=645133 RepID=E3QIV0_COLGM|nr:uncharacterized protein GLRG_05932 [Colletotrichum graminicola M1.001]EFQ30788.1 hypothetical protein GLRG_05932 [Colletotrichum graminicola M1.001]WDK21547.1 hypothetical protein CGRA01v4_12837 [Colletotrichum graminicola]
MDVSVAEAGSSYQALKAILAGARADPSTLRQAQFEDLLAVDTGKKIFNLRTWWKQVFGFDVSVLEMLGMGSL